MKISGIVMAGGKSSRMGKDKGLLMYNKRPMVTYPLEALKKFCSEIYISANNDEYKEFGYPIIKDEIVDTGPIGGLYSSLKFTNTEWNIVLACDMPFVSSTFLSDLISKIESGYDAIVPQNEKKQFEALCAVYSKTCLPQIEQKIKANEYGLYRLLKMLSVKKINISDNNRNFINLNTLDEFRRAEKEL